MKLFSCVWLFETPWTVAHQALPSMGFSRQEYWGGLPFPSPGHLPNPGIEPRLTAYMQTLPSEPQGKSHITYICCISIAQSCLTLWDPMDCSPPVSSIHGILQARILEWVAIPFSRGSSMTQGSNPSLLHCKWILYHWATREALSEDKWS